MQSPVSHKVLLSPEAPILNNALNRLYSESVRATNKTLEPIDTRNYDLSERTSKSNRAHAASCIGNR